MFLNIINKVIHGKEIPHMIAKKQLQELANVLKATPEYTEMVRQRRKIMSNQALNRLMQSFEKGAQEAAQPRFVRKGYGRPA